MIRFALEVLVLVLSDRAVPKAQFTKALDYLTSRPLVQSIALPSSVGFGTILSKEELEVSDEICDNLFVLTQQMHACLKSIEFHDETKPVHQDIHDDVWMRLWDSCKRMSFFSDDISDLGMLGLSGEEFDQNIVAVANAFMNASRVYLTDVQDNNTWFTTLVNLKPPVATKKVPFASTGVAMTGFTA